MDPVHSAQVAVLYSRHMGKKRQKKPHQTNPPKPHQKPQTNHKNPNFVYFFFSPPSPHPLPSKKIYMFHMLITYKTVQVCAAQTFLCTWWEAPSCKDLCLTPPHPPGKNQPRH